MIMITLSDILDVIGIFLGIIQVAVAWLAGKFGNKRGGT